MLSNTASTMYILKLMNRMKCNRDYTPIKNTTINEKLDIYPDSYENDIKYPTLNLLTIGSGGLIGEVGNNLDLITSPHSALHASLFNMTPFYLRRVDEMVTNPPSDKLRLKKTIYIHSIEYVAYYGYVITDYEDNDDIITFNNIEDEYVNISKVDINSSDVLNPVPTDNTLPALSDKNYMADLVKMYTFLTESELIEIKNAINILEPDTVPRITELGVCFSKLVDIDGEEEAIETQIGYFLDIDIDVDNGIDEGYIDFYLEVGGMEVIIR